MATTQNKHPWRAVVRTILAAIIGLAALAPVIFTAITQQSPEVATGAAAGILAVTGAITRVLALPGVESWLRKYLPWLAGGTDADQLPE